MATNDGKRLTSEQLAQIRKLGDVSDTLSLVGNRIADYLLLMSMIVTHDIVPDDERASVMISLEHAARTELGVIDAERETIAAVASTSASITD